MSLQNSLKRNFSFNKNEKHEFVFTVVILTIVMFMFIWRTTDYNIFTGILDLILIAILSLISMFVLIGGIKFFAIGKGYLATYNYWIGGLLGGFLISFISYGFVPILFPGIINIKSNDKLRHGQIFVAENRVDVFWILASGIITSIIFSFILLIIYSMTGLNMFYYGALMNAFIAFYTSLPFPNNIGLHMFYMKKNYYFYFLAITAIMLVLVQAQNMLALLSGLVIFGILIVIFKKFIINKFSI